MVSLVTVNALLIVLALIFTVFSLDIVVVSMAFSIMHPNCVCSFQAAILEVKVMETAVKHYGVIAGSSCCQGAIYHYVKIVQADCVAPGSIVKVTPFATRTFPVSVYGLFVFVHVVSEFMITRYVYIASHSAKVNFAS